MTRPSGDDPRPLIALVLVALGLVVAAHVGPWLRRLDLAQLRADGRPAALVLVALVALVLVARRLACRRTLAGRVTVELVPTDSFAPSVETVLRFAAGLGRSRRLLRGSLDAPASAVRIALDTDQDGRMRYRVTLPGHAAGALRTAVGAFGDAVEIRQPDDDATRPQPDLERVRVARAELVLARPSTEPLRSIGVDPDPLTGFAHALGARDPRERTHAGVAIDVLPLTAARARRERRRLIRQAHGGGEPLPALGALLAGRPARRPGPAHAAELVERGASRRALTSKLGQPEPLFTLQVLVRVSSPVPGVAGEQARGLLAAFDVFAGENHFRVSGLRIPGILFLGSDVPWRRRGFDRRWRTGRFAPARRGLVTASEIAGLLKPPTATCMAGNVLRSGGAIPRPPAGLPTFSGQPGLLPLGRVVRDGRERLVGVPLASTFFTYTAGRSRFGKTEKAIGQFIHLARSGHGCFFHDPHEDALTKIKEYLTDAGLRDRAIEINLASPAGRQPGWNLFAVHGRSPDRAAKQVDAVVDAFASTLQWDERNTRALNLVTQSAQALTELAAQLPPELAPTLFQVPTLLGNDDWRAAVLPHLSAPTRQFFADRFPRLPAGAITPVTNLIDRLRVAPAVAALLGSPTCTYDIRKAMDNGMIVLACPGFGSERDRLVANLLVYDLLHAARTRASIPPERRRPFHVFLDEIQTHDGPSLAALLEQMAKFGLRGMLFNQNPERLSPTTLNAVTTNRSHLDTTALNAKAAALLTREWAGAVDPDVVTRLPRYRFLASVTLDGEITPPFLLHGVPADELHADAHHPDQVHVLDEAIDTNINRQPIADTLVALDEHDRDILNHLRTRRRPRGTASGAHGQDDHPTAMTGPVRLHPLAVDLLESIHQHRLLTNRQLHALHSPTSSLRWPQRLTADLARLGLIDAVTVAKRRRLHYVTAAGADAVALLGTRSETRRTVIRPEQAAGPLRHHTLAINDAGICFVQAARDHDDQCGPWAWRHEIAHPIGSPPGQRHTEHVIADVLLTYQRTAAEQTSFHYRLIELDRATMAADDLATKLARYARLYHYTLPGTSGDDSPLWTQRYPVFPTVLVVLAGAERRALQRRRRDVLALCGLDQELQDAPEVRIDLCLLQDLKDAGPYAPIFHNPGAPDRPTDWLGAEDER